MLPKCHRLRTGMRNGNKSSMSRQKEKKSSAFWGNFFVKHYSTELYSAHAPLVILFFEKKKKEEKGKVGGGGGGGEALNLIIEKKTCWR